MTELILSNNIRFGCATGRLKFRRRTEDERKWTGTALREPMYGRVKKERKDPYQVALVGAGRGKKLK